jgi:glutaredoxin-like protein NrdH
MTITVYTVPDNMESKTTKMFLEKRNLPYSEVSLTADAEAWKLVTEKLGYTSAPVVIIRDSDGNITNHWKGFSPINIGKL